MISSATNLTFLSTVAIVIIANLNAVNLVMISRPQTDDDDDDLLLIYKSSQFVDGCNFLQYNSINRARSCLFKQPLRSGILCEIESLSITTLYEFLCSIIQSNIAIRTTIQLWCLFFSLFLYTHKRERAWYLGVSTCGRTIQTWQIRTSPPRERYLCLVLA